MCHITRHISLAWTFTRVVAFDYHDLFHHMYDCMTIPKYHFAGLQCVISADPSYWTDIDD